MAVTPTQTPHEWYATINKVLLGWYWERKEIENYLIDPEVVKRALGNKAPPMNDYQAALRATATKLADYTAARIALSCVSYPNPPYNSWGEERERGHFFPKEKGLKEPDCRSQIKNILATKQRELKISENQVLAKFEQQLEQCRLGGKRFEYYLTFLAGKDLLYLMRHDLKKLGFKDSPQQPACYTFRDSILRGIQSKNEVWTWLPEWQRLRELLSNGY